MDAPPPAAPTATVPPQRKRRRPALSCEQCRRRKIKCDRNWPCGHCTRSNAEACTYTPDDHLTAAAKNRRIGLEQGHATSSSNASPASQSRGQRLDDTEASDSVHSTPSVHALVDRVQQLEQKLRDSATTQSVDGSDTFSKVLGIFREAESDENSEIHALVDKCKRLARATKSQQPFHQPTPSDFRDYVPPKQVSDQLAHFYLQTFESVYRILHIPSFQKEYTLYWQNPESASTAFVMKLLLVLAIGTCFYQDHDSASLRSSSTRWIYAAQSWLSYPFEKSRVNITGVQIHCLLLLARQTNSVSGDLVWISTGSLLRSAMQIGMHRDPSNMPGITYFQAEMRRRLWATVLELVVQSSMDSGGPPLISCQDFDCELPSNIDDTQMDEDGKTSAVPKPKDTFTQSSVQIVLMQSFPLRLEVTKYLNDFRSEASYDGTLRLGTDLSAALREKSRLFQSFRAKEARPTAFQTKILDVMTHRFLLGLHHPFALKAKSNPIYYFSRKVCLEQSLFILSYEQAFRSQDLIAVDDEYTHFRTLGGGPFKDIPLRAALYLCMELITQLEDDSAPFTSESNSLSQREIHKAVEGFVQLSGERIKAGETNVRNHVFPASILAHINAVQAGKSSDEEILRAMRDSLEASYNFLVARHEEIGARPLDSGGSAQQETTAQFQPEEFGWYDITQETDFNLDFPESWLFPNAIPIDGGI